MVETMAILELQNDWTCRGLKQALYRISQHCGQRYAGALLVAVAPYRDLQRMQQTEGAPEEGAPAASLDESAPDTEGAPGEGTSAAPSEEPAPDTAAEAQRVAGAQVFERLEQLLIWQHSSGTPPVPLKTFETLERLRVTALPTGFYGQSSANSYGLEGISLVANLAYVQLLVAAEVKDITAPPLEGEPPLDPVALAKAQNHPSSACLDLCALLASALHQAYTYEYALAKVVIEANSLYEQQLLHLRAQQCTKPLHWIKEELQSEAYNHYQRYCRQILPCDTECAAAEYLLPGAESTPVQLAG